MGLRLHVSEISKKLSLGLSRDVAVEERGVNSFGLFVDTSVLLLHFLRLGLFARNGSGRDNVSYLVRKEGLLTLGRSQQGGLEGKGWSTYCTKIGNASCETGSNVIWYTFKVEHHLRELCPEMRLPSLLVNRLSLCRLCSCCRARCRGMVL